MRGRECDWIQIFGVFQPVTNKKRFFFFKKLHLLLSSSRISNIIINTKLSRELTSDATMISKFRRYFWQPCISLRAGGELFSEEDRKLGHPSPPGYGQTVGPNNASSLRTPGIFVLMYRWLPILPVYAVGGFHLCCGSKCHWYKEPGTASQKYPDQLVFD